MDGAEKKSCFPRSCWGEKEKTNKLEKQQTLLNPKLSDVDKNEIDGSKLPTINIKCLMLGDGSAGKSYAATRYTTGVLRTDYTPTIFDTVYKNIVVDQKLKDFLDNADIHLGQKIQLEVADTAGQEDYDSIRSISYCNTNVVLLAVDLTSKITLENAYAKWLPQIQASPDLKNCPIVFGAMKEDAWAWNNEHEQDITAKVKRNSRDSKQIEDLEQTGDSETIIKHVIQDLVDESYKQIKRNRGVEIEEISLRIIQHSVVKCSAFTERNIEELFLTILKHGLMNMSLIEKYPAEILGMF